jgi:predicted GNAT superfamily acetyltransferase
MITYSTSKTDAELAEILQLQKNNLPQNLTESEMTSQGFVTVSHSLDDLRKLNNYEQHVVMKDKNKMAGYLLAMTQHSKHDIPVLIPMFEMFDKIIYNNKLISEYNYIVVGQVCIEKNYRGQGLLNEMYAAYKNNFQHKYDFAITEIATNNIRSIRAHQKVGFFEVHIFIDASNTEWSIVIWDWK